MTRWQAPRFASLDMAFSLTDPFSDRYYASKPAALKLKQLKQSADRAD